MLQEAGVDICDVSAGQTSIAAQPVYGRMFQTPFSDRIRNETGMATMAVGNIFEPDHVNSILMAGRADLVCLARPHLADPYWTLHAAAKLGDRGEAWPPPYYAGRDQLYRIVRQRRTRADGGMTDERLAANTRLSPAAAAASAPRSRSPWRRPARPSRFAGGAGSSSTKRRHGTKIFTPKSPT